MYLLLYYDEFKLNTKFLYKLFQYNIQYYIILSTRVQKIKTNYIFIYGNIIIVWISLNFN